MSRKDKYIPKEFYLINGAYGYKVSRFMRGTSYELFLVINKNDGWTPYLKTFRNDTYVL